MYVCMYQGVCRGYQEECVCVCVCVHVFKVVSNVRVCVVWCVC